MRKMTVNTDFIQDITNPVGVRLPHPRGADDYGKQVFKGKLPRKTEIFKIDR